MAEGGLVDQPRVLAGVQVDDYNENGRVYLELADATPAETARGMAMLQKLAG